MATKISGKSVQVCVSVPNGIYEILEKCCAETDISVSGFCRESTIRRLEALSLVSAKIKGHEL